MNRFFPGDIPRAMNGNAWRSPRRRKYIAAHLSDRATKHEHQADAKNEFADDFCFDMKWLFHFVSFPFVLRFSDLCFTRLYRKQKTRFQITLG